MICPVFIFVYNARMLTVGINTSTPRAAIALVCDGKLVAEKSWTSDRDEAEKLLPAIAAVLKKARVLKKSGALKKTPAGWKDISEVFVVSGPGPFTGLRIGVTVANVLGWSTAGALRSVDVFEYLAARVPKFLSTGAAVLVKGGGDFFAVRTVQTKKKKLVHLQDLPEVLKKAKVKRLVAEMKTADVALLKKFFVREKVKVQFVAEKSLKTFGETMVELLNGHSSRHSGKRLVQPLYLQKPTITQSKKPQFV